MCCVDSIDGGGRNSLCAVLTVMVAINICVRRCSADGGDRNPTAGGQHAGLRDLHCSRVRRVARVDPLFAGDQQGLRAQRPQ